MRRSTLILAAAAADWIIGDPEWFPHPVRIIGAAVTRGETLLHPEATKGSPRRGDARSGDLLELAAGLTLAAGVVAAAYRIPAELLRRAPRAIVPFLQVLLAATTLAARNLDDEAREVIRSLELGCLPQARERLARIVGRDTAPLDEAGICRALIETLAESLSDGVVAPLFFLALGGVPAAMAFKAVSTMDSMIGHRTPRYLYFGRPAARLDDCANFLPARLTALGLLAFAPRAFPVYARDRRKHESPNAGHPEAAMAGVLGVQLGGANSYAGERHEAPLLNAGQPLPTLREARRALILCRAVAIAAACVAACLVFAAERRNA